MESVPRDISNHPWIFVILVIGFGLLAYLNYAHSRKLRVQVDGFITNRHVGQIMRDEGPGSQIPVGILLALSIIAHGLFGYLAVRILDISIPDYRGSLIFTAACIILIVLFLIKAGITRLISFIVGEADGSREHIYNMFLFAEVSGLFLLPVVVAMAYVPEEYAVWAFYLGCAIIGLTYLYRIISGILIGLRYKLSGFYLILYLCTLEILPLIVLIKVFSGEI